MNILVTGGGGFIGGALVQRLLADGHKVRSVDIVPGRLDKIEHPHFELCLGDIRDEALLAQAVAGIDIVYHLASAHLDITLSNKDYWDINVNATENLLRCAQNAGVKRLVHCSTNGVIGQIDYPPADEKTACRPTNIYEETKLAGEKAALTLAQQGATSVVVVRPAWVFGPHCPRTEKLFRMIGTGRFVMFGDGETLRHPIYIDDFIAGITLCGKRQDADGEIFFLAGTKATTINELVEQIAQTQSVSLTTIRLPLWLGKIAGNLLQATFKPLGKSPPFSRRSLDFFIKDNAYSIEKARKLLGFAPQISLENGLRQTYQWLSNKE